MRVLLAIVVLNLTASAAMAVQCEKIQFVQGREVDLGPVSVFGRGTSGNLSDGYTFSITDAPGDQLTLQIIEPNGQIVSKTAGPDTNFFSLYDNDMGLRCKF